MDSIRPEDVRPDPIVTEWAIQYGVGGPFIADEALPLTPPVKQRSFKFQTYKADELNDEIETRVGPSGKPNEVRSQKPTFTSATCERNALDDSMSDEVRDALTNPLLGGERRTRKLTHKLRLGIEKAAYAIFHAATKTTAAGTTWDNASATALGVRKNLDDAAEAMELRIGNFEPHVAISVTVARVISRLVSGYVVAGRPDMFLGGLFPQGLWGYTWHIAGALQNTGNPKADFSQTIARVWGADKEAYLFATDTSPDLESMAFGYQVPYQPNGVPYQGYTWRDPHVSVKKTWFSVDNFQIPLLVCDDACQKITGVLA
ncbi:MAG: hypothetical protein PHS14_17960 [Elusimicrobia bacterium]|nr:hypothetical protein [Elusimicrobiota bacterium]